MPNPYSPYLVMLTVTHSSGTAAEDADVTVTTSIGVKDLVTDSVGRVVYDLANIGYTAGETVTVDVQDEFNNQYKQYTFVLGGDYHSASVQLEQRTTAQGKVVGYTDRVLLYGIGDKPITSDNPLAVKSESDLIVGYVLSGVDDINRYYGYMDNSGAWYIQRYESGTKTYKYARGSSDFSGNWNNRTGLTYSFFSEVF